MDNRSKKLNKSENGFIQIPILITFLILGAVATSGGYYAVKHNNKSEVIKVVNGNTVPDIEVKFEERSELGTTKSVSSGLKLSEVSGVKWDDTIIESEASSVKEGKFIPQLTTMKEMVDELNEAESEVKTKIVRTETDISDLRIEKLKALIVPANLEVINKTYEVLIEIEEIRKSNIKLVLGSSLLGTLFYSMEIDSTLKSLKNGETKEGISTAQKLVDTHSVRLDWLKDQSVKAVETAISENKAYAQEFLLRFDSTMSTANRYSELTQMLGEIQQVRKDIESALATTVSNSYYIQPAQVVSQAQSSLSASSCKFPTSKYVLIPGKGWVAVMQCQNGTYIEASKYTPDTSTMTQQQVCDMRKAGQLSGGAYISDSQPDPVCK